MEPVTEWNVLNYTQCLKNKISTGYDNLSSKLFKQISEEIVQPLTFFINRSLEDGTFPDSLKIAKVVPAFKDGERLEVKHHRPISILPSISKVYEYVNLDRLQ